MEAFGCRSLSYTDNGIRGPVSYTDSGIRGPVICTDNGIRGPVSYTDIRYHCLNSYSQ